MTITVEEEVLRWAKVWAARHDSSVSRLVGDLLRQKMLDEEGYEAAMARYLSQPPRVLKKSGRYPRREEVHARQAGQRVR
ncbi:MAG: hypothetical protein HY646_06610 [Acidobacteria bacterium]|nr:hypothetical protein [Acidobacteriota bacterium]